MKSKLKKHQEYSDLNQLTVFPQLFDGTNLSDVTTLPNKGSRFHVENFVASTLVAVECLILSYKLMTQDRGNLEGYSINLLSVLFLDHPSEDASQPSTPKKKGKELEFSSPSCTRQLYHNPSMEIDK